MLEAEEEAEVETVIEMFIDEETVDDEFAVGCDIELVIVVETAEVEELLPVVELAEEQMPNMD